MGKKENNIIPYNNNSSIFFFSVLTNNESSKKKIKIEFFEKSHKQNISNKIILLTFSPIISIMYYYLYLLFINILSNSDNSKNY